MDAKAFTVTVTYKVRPGGGRSVGLLSYTDKVTGRSFKKVFVELLQYEDIFALVGSIRARWVYLSVARRD